MAASHITQSEAELNKGYSDIYMEPFMSKYPDLKYFYLIELKYIARGEYSEKIQQEQIQDAKEKLDQLSTKALLFKSFTVFTTDKAIDFLIFIPQLNLHCL